MATRVVEWKKPYTWWKAISIDEDKVISLNLRDENNLIIYDEWDDEIYVDLQLDDEITPTDAFPIWVNVGRVIVDNWWDLPWTIISAVTTSGDNIKIFYADEWTLWIDNGTWTFKQIYFKADVDALLLALRNYIDWELAKKQNWVSSDTAPSDPSEWDLWYDTANSAMKVWDWTAWQSVGWWDVLVSDHANNIFTPWMKIWGWTQSDYQSLTPDSNTAYLLLAGWPAPTGWDTITGFNYDNISFWFGSQEQEVQGMIWGDDWNKFYLVWEWWDKVYQYSCSTAYDISTASYDNKSLSINDTVPRQVRFNPTWTQMYILCKWNNTESNIYIYNLSTAWDITTATYNASSANLDARAYWIFISPDWLYLFANSDLDALKRYPLSTAWDLTSFSTADQTISSFPKYQNIYFNPQWTQMFGLRRSNPTYIDLYTLSTAWDITTISSPTAINIWNWDAMAFWFNDDWSKAYACWRTDPNRTMYQYSTTTA